MKITLSAMCGDAGVAARINGNAQRAWDKLKLTVTAGLTTAAFTNQIPKELNAFLVEAMQGIRFTTRGNIAEASTQVSMQTIRAAAQAAPSMPIVPPSSAEPRPRARPRR
jgi:hypothetical protein